METKMDFESEHSLDFIIRVDRSVKSSYNCWVKKLENPELECSGPTEYNLQTGVEQWLHNGLINGDQIYDHLKKDNALASCLNLQDGLAIQQKGITVFRQLFGGKSVFLWGSVVRGRRYRRVPYVFEYHGEITVGWDWLKLSWLVDSIVLRFK